MHVVRVKTKDVLSYSLKGVVLHIWFCMMLNHDQKMDAAGMVLSLIPVMPSKDCTSKCQSNAVPISLICGIPLGNVLGPFIFKQIKGLHVVDYKNKLASVVRMCVG